MKRIIVLCTFLFGLINIMYSQTNNEWSLERCISYAIENNLTIKQQEVKVQQSENSVLQSKMDFIPTLSASVNHSMSWGRSVNLQDLQIIKNHISQSTSANLSSSIGIIEGMTKINTLKSNQTSLKISIEEMEYQKNQIAIEIAKSYLQVLLSKKIKEAASESYFSMLKQVENTRKLVDAGSKAYGSLLEIEAQLATEKVQLTTAENDYKINYLQLKQLLDLGGERDFAIKVPEFNNLISQVEIRNLEEIYGTAIDLPQIRSAELSLEKSKTDLKIEKGKSYPSLSFSAGYGTYYSDGQKTAFFKQFNENKNPSIGFALNIPIFNHLSNYISIKNAQLNIKNSEISLKTRKQDLYKEIQQLCNQAVAALDKFKASEQNMISLKESFGYTENKFNLGLLNATDYTVAKANLFKATSEYYQAVYQYVFQVKILDFYTGIPLSL